MRLKIVKKLWALENLRPDSPRHGGFGGSVYMQFWRIPFFENPVYALLVKQFHIIKVTIIATLKRQICEMN